MNDSNGRDDLSLGDLLSNMLRFLAAYGRLVIPLSLLAAALAAGFAARHPIYSGSALLETSEMPLDKWRRLQPMLSDRTLVASSVAQAGLSEEQKSRLVRAFQQPAYWGMHVRYRPTVGRDDFREQINIDPKKVGVLGLEVTLEARDEDHARQRLELIARHIRHAMLWSDLTEYLNQLRQSTTEKRLRLQIDLIKHQFAIEQNLQQVEEMHKLLQQYPELRRAEVNTVVSVGDGGGKYLSPLAQIVALQSTVAETRTAQRQAERELEQLGWFQRFLDETRERASSIHSGPSLLEWLQRKRHELFPDDVNAAHLQVGREIEMNLAQMQSKAEQLQYRARPALSEKPVVLRRPSFVAMMAFVATFIMMSLGLALYRTMRRVDKMGSSHSPRHGWLFSWSPGAVRRRLSAPAVESTRTSDR